MTIELSIHDVTRLTIDPLETYSSQDDLPPTQWREMTIEWRDDDGVVQGMKITMFPAGSDIEISTGNVELTKALYRD